MTETSAEIDGVFFQPTGVGRYDCHIEGLNFLSIYKLRVTTVSLQGHTFSQWQRLLLAMLTI